MSPNAHLLILNMCTMQCRDSTWAYDLHLLAHVAWWHVRSATQPACFVIITMQSMLLYTSSSVYQACPLLMPIRRVLFDSWKTIEVMLYKTHSKCNQAARSEHASKNMTMTKRDRFGLGCYDPPLCMAKVFVQRVLGVQMRCIGTFYVEQLSSASFFVELSAITDFFCNSVKISVILIPKSRSFR